MQKMSKIMDNRTSEDLEAEYKDEAGVFTQRDKLLSASSEMIDLNRVVYKAGVTSFSDLHKMSFISGIVVQIGNISVPTA